MIKNYRDYFISPSIKNFKGVSVAKIVDELHLSIPLFLKRVNKLNRVAICVTDNTRHFPEKIILPHILKILNTKGIKIEQITIIVATGLHRHLNKIELIDKFGEHIVSNYRIVQNNPDEAVCVGNRFDINKILIESDAILGTGVFEPHQYAGFSGGNKIFVIGCGGRETINYIHSLNMVLKQGVRIGNINNNPFKKFIDQRADLLPPRWVINIVLDGDGDIVAFRSGIPEDVSCFLSKWYFENLTFKFTQKTDAAFVVVGKSKGVNLYQASRGATYLTLSASPIIKEGAPIVVLASLKEGSGRGEGEREFFKILSSKLDNYKLLKSLKNRDIKGGGQRSVMLLQTLLKHPVIFTGYEKKINLKRENLLFIKSPVRAIDLVVSKMGRKKILYVKNPFTGLFLFSEEKKGDE